MKIIVDAMGGDNAPLSNVRGAVAAVKEQGVERRTPPSPWASTS